MKKSILFLVLLQSLLIFAQAPQKMTYQSVVRNSANVLLANQAVGVRISILEGSLSGTAVYSETHTVTTNANGLFTLEAGGGTPTEGVFADIVWGNGSHYIKSEIDPTGGTNYTLSATKELLSVPYALYAVNGITTAQADAITALQAQITSLLPTTVLVGTQTWKAKNLNVTTYRNGDVIPEVQDGTEWTSLTTGAWCHYNNDPANDAIYGKLYNWYAVNDPRGLAPSGFHVPTDAELNAVTDMKDSSGFAGLPGGNRYSNGEFNFIGSYGIWWSSSEYDTTYAWNRRLNYDLDDAYSEAWGKRQGYSVRCVKDEDSVVNPIQAQIAAQADAITAQASTIAALQAQIAAMQVQITALLPTPTIIVTVTIGEQLWTTKNLNVTTYRNGNIIPEVQDPSAWASLTTGAWCHYNNDSNNDAIYGKLYNWYAVNDPRGLAPSGYHISTDAEWTTLTTFLGGQRDAAGKMKATTLWNASNQDHTNSSGFTGLPGGFRRNDGTFLDIGNGGYWWSSSAYDTTNIWYRYLDYYDGGAKSYLNKTGGLSVRCLRD